MEKRPVKAYCFDFGRGPALPDTEKVGPDTIYSSVTGYGFTSDSTVYARLRAEDGGQGTDFCIPRGAVFLADVPDGIYRITVCCGDSEAETETIIRAGEGKAVLPPLRVPAGQIVRESFSIRAAGGRLRLAFSGGAPRINMLEITPDPEALAVVLAGDSTVADQGEAGYPYAGWGQLLPRMFKAGVAVDNRAVSGRSAKSFISEGRLERLAAELRAGDYLFIQFGHNDAKKDEPRYTSPFTTYKECLLSYVEAARTAGAHPVLVTPVQRRRFGPDGKLENTHGEYPAAMKELAGEQGIPLIDLGEKSRRLFEAYGPGKSKELFMWCYPGEYLGHPAGVKDDTHFQVKGARVLAEEIVQGIREAGLNDLIIYLRGDANEWI